MATGAQTWSTTAASNNSIDSSVNWAEGMAPSAVNNSARAEMASAAMHIGDNSGTLLTSGSTTAYTVTSKQVSTSLVNGYTIMVNFHATNDANATLNVDGSGAKAMQLYNGTNVAGGEFLGGSLQRFTYHTTSTSWVLNNYRPASVSSLLAADGTVGAPSHSFTNDTDCGLYRIGANNIGFSIGGGKVQDLSTSGLAVTGVFSASGAATLSSSLTVTGASLLSGTGTISGAATMSSSLTVVGNALLSGALALTGAGTLSSSLTVANGVLLSSGLTVAGAATFQSSTTHTGAALFSGATTIANVATITSSLVAAAASFTSATLSSSLNVSGATQVAALAGTTGTFTGAVSGATVTGSMVATQAQQETGTATDVIVTPGRQHYHQSACKAFGRFTYAGGTPSLTAGFNFSSTVADNGTGDMTVNFTTALTAGYAVVGTAHYASNKAYVVVKSASTTQININTINAAGDPVDVDAVSLIVFGDMP